MKRPEPTYPNVRCAHGHPDEPGYVVCRHIVFAGENPVHIVLATPTACGEILCGAHHAGTSDEFVAVCAACARGHKWLRT